jgi:DNA-binding SARP family transcriptional activator
MRGRMSPLLVTFGGLSVTNGIAINGVANPRSRLAILAVLATAGDRGIRRDKLAAMFWPESDEERARNALRQALFTLRRDLGGGDLILGGVDIKLNPGVLSADVAEFDLAVQDQRYEEAVALYAGPFLDGVFVREAPEFERWAEEQRHRLSADYGRALGALAAAASARGDVTGATSWYSRLATHDPFSGRVAIHYMEALVAAGDRARAVHHAALYGERVRVELETEPDADVVALAERLRKQTGARVASHDDEAAQPDRARDAESVAEPPARDASASPITTIPPQSGVRRRVDRRWVLLFALPVLAAIVIGVRHGRRVSALPPVVAVA